MCLKIVHGPKNKLTFEFSNIMDTQNSKNAEIKILEAINASPDVCNVVFDMGKVGYTASFFIRICVSVKRHNRVDNFSMVNVTDDVYKIFELLDLTKILNISQ